MDFICGSYQLILFCFSINPKICYNALHPLLLVSCQAPRHQGPKCQKCQKKKKSPGFYNYSIFLMDLASPSQLSPSWKGVVWPTLESAAVFDSSNSQSCTSSQINQCTSNISKDHIWLKSLQSKRYTITDNKEEKKRINQQIDINRLQSSFTQPLCS